MMRIILDCLRTSRARPREDQGDTGVVETDERVLAKTAEIRVRRPQHLALEENALCSLSGVAVTPDSQLDESTSPADTTEEDPLPMRPWGRSQSLPAYADFIMRTSSSSFNNNLTETREEVAESSLDAPKNEVPGKGEGPAESQRETTGETKMTNQEAELTASTTPVNQLDFYKTDPFVHCQSEHVFASDPFKGTDPFAADILFPAGRAEEGGPAAAVVAVADEGDTSLSCVENKASTGTQCFESEFPDEDSDIEISYSREDLATDTNPQAAAAETGEPRGFKPIQSSASEDLGLEGACRGWRSQGQYSVESDPNGYELDLGAVSPPSDIEELSLGSLTGDAAAGKKTAAVQGLISDLAQYSPELPPFGADSDPIMSAPDMAQLVITEQPMSCEVTPSQEAQHLASEMDNSFEVEPQPPLVQQNSDADVQNPMTQISSEMNECSFEMSYPSTHSSFDPYGFKLSPEHSTHSLLDPDDEEDLSPELNDPDLAFDPEPTSSQLNFDCYGFDLASSRVASEDVFDPYGFKLSQEEENQEVLEAKEKAQAQTQGIDLK
ncbi:hypothetical protein CRUP_028746 [Coryphaenoides rupestris]|nr:hypothetical protein CRUP_028746 [Coryphaenoides rupestris]